MNDDLNDYPDEWGWDDSPAVPLTLGICTTCGDDVEDRYPCSHAQCLCTAADEEFPTNPYCPVHVAQDGVA